MIGYAAAYALIIGALVGYVFGNKAWQHGRMIAWCGISFVLVMALLWEIPWTPRQIFFRQIANIRSGSSVSAVETSLKEYTPVPGNRFNGSTGPPARPLDNRLTGTLIYRRSNENSSQNDFGIIVFKNGKVVEIHAVAD
ncbi:MAG: hypothetical protein OHK0029_22180 [Armatimonadaceae bacterium]